MTEKYDVVDLNRRAGGGEYPTQDGFGWSNGVALALAAQVGDDAFRWLDPCAGALGADSDRSGGGCRSQPVGQVLREGALCRLGTTPSYEDTRASQPFSGEPDAGDVHADHAHFPVAAGEQGAKSLRTRDSSNSTARSVVFHNWTSELVPYLIGSRRPP